jgi:hypothetical protein
LGIKFDKGVFGLKDYRTAKSFSVLPRVGVRGRLYKKRADVKATTQRVTLLLLMSYKEKWIPAYSRMTILTWPKGQ